MKPLPETTLNIQDITRMFSKYRRSMVTTALFFGILFTAVSYRLPKKYKSDFVLTIDGKYFQSPLIGDFVPSLSGGGEPRSQRESLIRQVLTPDYLDSLGQKYGIYTSTATYSGKRSWVQDLRSTVKSWCIELGLYQVHRVDSLLPAEREMLRSRIEIYDLNSTTFKIGFIYSDPDATFAIVQDLHAHLIQGLLDMRARTLANIRDAIEKGINSLEEDMAGSSGSRASVHRSPVANELAEVRHRIRNLAGQYTEEHPLMKQLRDRERILVAKLNNAEEEDSVSPNPTPAVENPIPQGLSKDANRGLLDDLTKKLNYLTIAIDSDQEHQDDYFTTLESPLYPNSPLWPKKGLFGAYGVAFGFFCAFFIGAIREYFERSALHTEALAQQLGIPLLGQLPFFPLKVRLRSRLAQMFRPKQIAPRT